MSLLDGLAAGFALVAHWQSVFYLALGLVIGVIGGAIPGISATMTVALTLPFTFTLPPIYGILLLLGVYKGGIFGGSIPAILIKTPGTPASSATTLDGYPLAERGEAGRALGMALYASCIADFISNVSLILFAGWLATFALKFGPPEFFALIVFSLTIIAGVSGESLIKGVIAAVGGLFLATIGLDLVYGTDRFSFGDANLMGGLNFIAVLIGLFALPEIIKHVFNPAEEHLTAREPTGRWASLADLRHCLKTIIRGGLIGVILGAIPGIGGAPAAFLSYSEAQRNSPNRSNFGKGELEGVAAAEAGNNGVCGATLIPLLALGVPGDVITAIIIGAFMIHGLQPGPMLFVTNADIVYALFMGLILSSLLLLVIGTGAIRLFRVVADIPKSLQVPAVLVLCVFGTFAINSSMFDVITMFVIGALGYLMLVLAIPAAPFLIGFILGPLLEDKFRQSMLMSGGAPEIFVRSPITWLFWVLTALALYFIIASLRRSWAPAGRSRLRTGDPT